MLVLNAFTMTTKVEARGMKDIAANLYVARCTRCIM